MGDNDKKSILIMSGSTKMLDQMKSSFNEEEVKVYLSRSTFNTVQILLTKQVDAIFLTSGFSHVVESIRLFSTIPCAYVVCPNCLKPGGADFLIDKEEFDVNKMPQYLDSMIKLNQLRTKFKGIVWFSRLKIDIDNYTVEYDGKSFKLKPLEIKLLFFLCKHLNRVVSRKRLLATVWGYEEAGATRTLDVHIMSLRSLLTTNNIPLEIQTYRSEGYKLFDTETNGGSNYFA